MSTSFQPEHRKELFKLASQRHGVLIEEAQLEESSIRLEAVCHMHRLLSAGDVVALKRFPVHIMPFNGADGTRPCHIAGNAQFAPFFVSRLITFGSQRLCFVHGNLIICDHDTAPMSTVFRVQQIDSMECGAGTGKEIYNKGTWLISNKKPYRIMFCVQRFWK